MEHSVFHVIRTTEKNIALMTKGAGKKKKEKNPIIFMQKKLLEMMTKSLGKYLQCNGVLSRVFRRFVKESNWHSFEMIKNRNDSVVVFK